MGTNCLVFVFFFYSNHLFSSCMFIFSYSRFAVHGAFFAVWQQSSKPGLFPTLFLFHPLESLIFYHLWTTSCELTGVKWPVPPAQLWRSAGTIHWEQSLAVKCLPHTWEEAESLLGSSCAWCCAGPWELPQAQEGAHGSSITPLLSPDLSEGCWSHQWPFPQDKRPEWPSESHLSKESVHGASLHPQILPTFQTTGKKQPQGPVRCLWITRACRYQSLPKFPWLFSHRHQHKPQNTLSSCPQRKTHSSHLGICIPPLPIPTPPWKELKKLQGMKAEGLLPDWLHSP